MFTRIFTITILLMISAVQPSKAQVFSDMEWILGSWIQETETRGLDIVENWQKVSDELYTGENIAKDANGNIVSVEKMTLEKRGESMVFTAQPDTSKPPVVFRIVRVDRDNFLARNNTNDFPKQIIYTRTPDGMTADLSGSGRLTRILFKKIEFLQGD